MWALPKRIQPYWLLVLYLRLTYAEYTNTSCARGPECTVCSSCCLGITLPDDCDNCVGLHCAKTESLNNEYFRISVLDGATGRGVPLVQLRTGNYISLWSDNAGNIAFNEPGMMDQPVFFSVLSDGYNFTGGILPEPIKDDPRGTDPGIVLFTARGGNSTLFLNRTQIAQRMYRLTGGGRWRDTLLSGAALPPQAQGDRATIDPGGVLGQDSVLTAVYKGQVYWMFGDSACARSARADNCDSYGMYTVGATSCLPLLEGKTGSASCITDPPVLDYINEIQGGFLHMRPMMPIPPKKRNSWAGGLTVVRRGTPDESFFAHYYKPSNGGGSADPDPIEGIAKWNDSARHFEPVSVWPQADNCPGLGQTVQQLSPTDAKSGYVYYAGSGVDVRVPDTLVAVGAHSCSSFEIRYENGSWHRIGHHSSSSSRPSSSSYSSGAPSRAAPYSPPEWLGSGSVNWNTWAQRYVFLAAGDTSALHQSAGGSMHIAFSWTLDGPWVNGTRIGDHNISGGSCYNGLQLPSLDAEGGRIVHIACTYTAMWSNTIVRPWVWSTCLFGLGGEHQDCSPVVPRYEYNNLVYRVDLAHLLK